MSQYLDRINDPLQRAGEALGRAVNDVADFVRAFVEFAAAVLTPEAIDGAKEKVVIAQAPPRIRHLALHSKKRRTRKKNINRALREYQRRNKK